MRWRRPWPGGVQNWGMTMADNSDDIEGLEAFFAAGRISAPEMSDGLMARILGDAAVEQARIQARKDDARAARPVLASAARPSPWRVLIEVLGGRKAVAGLLTAALAGLWLGFSPPQPLSSLTQTVAQSVLGSASSLEGLDLLPTLDTVLTQG